MIARLVIAFIVGFSVGHAVSAYGVAPIRVPSMLPAVVSVEGARVSMGREDFEAMVRAYNTRLEEIRELRAKIGCP